jgi:hypothetical protein
MGLAQGSVSKKPDPIYYEVSTYQGTERTGIKKSKTTTGILIPKF